MNEGTACSASYNCSNYSSSGTCSESNHAQGSRWTCTGSGTQTANGSTTSAAQSAAQAKCTCTTYGVPSASKSCSSIRGSSCTGTEGECSYTGTWSGTATGSSSDADSASGACKAAAFVIGMNALGSACSCGNKTYTYTVSRVPTASDCHTACGNSTAISYGSSTLTRTGSSTYCADAKTVANRNWYDYLEANKSAYCNCNPSGTVRFVLNTSHTYGVNAAIRLSNGAGTSINLGKNGSSSSFTTSPGSYSVGIQTQPGCANSTGVVSQCRSYSISPQNITVVSGQTVTVTMTVNC